MIIKISQKQYRWLSEAKDIIEKKQLNELKHIAQKSNITIASLEDFKTIVSSLGITDNNVEKFIGEYCFIEIGSGYSRIKAELPHTNFSQNVDDFYNSFQWYFMKEHPNVLKLEFDDNQKFNNKLPKKDGFDGKTPATAVKLSSSENKYGKNGFTFYYENGCDFTNEMAVRLKTFVDNNISRNPNIKFIIHCMQGKSRSAAVGTYVAKKINQLTDEFLSEYDNGEESQINIGISKKGQPKYPHKNVMTRMGEIEGWNKSNDDTKNQWFYNTLVNHPNTGYLAKKNKVNEDVFVNGITNKRNKEVANLTYNKRKSAQATRNIGNMKSADMLDTGKMDQNNNDTFIVPLKGGINSYNITSIKGTEVMHYFKNKINQKKTNIDIKLDGKNTELELFMEDEEFKEFENVFIKKVSIVVNHAISDFKNKENFTEVSIYPVPSSSNFNDYMCRAIAGRTNICGLPTRAITTTIFKKDLSDLQKDTDFINKNKDYYSRRMYIGGDNDMTHEEYLDDTIRKYNNTTAAQDETLINNYNMWINRVLTTYRNKSSIEALVKNYQNLVNAYQAIRKKLGKNKWTNAFSQIKYAKGPSIEKRSQNIWDLVTPYLGKTYMNQNSIEIVQIRPENFQIKNLSNDTRMGLKNYFKVQDNTEEEIKRVQNTVFVIFDDNVSGGATLSDICYQCKKLGINYLVPITFGEMRTKYSQSRLQIDKPTKSGRFENY